MANSLLDSAAAIRETLFDGLAEVPVFAEAVGKTQRTVQTWIQQGLPVTHFGNKPMVRLKEAQAWFASRKQKPGHEPRRPGRPRKVREPEMVVAE